MNAPKPFPLTIPTLVATPGHELLVYDRGPQYLEQVDKLYEVCNAHFADNAEDRRKLQELADANEAYLGQFARYLMRRTVAVADLEGLGFPHGDAAYKVVAYRIAEEWVHKHALELAA